MVRKNKAVIITSSSTYESRVNAIEEFLSSKGYNILVFEPEFDHHLKQKDITKRRITDIFLCWHIKRIFL